jgi:histone H2A
MSKTYSAGKTTAAAKNQGLSRSARAGLQFPVGRIHRYLLEKNVKEDDEFYGEKIWAGASASHFSAGVLEYLTKEILELAVDVCKQNKKKQITPRVLQQVFNKDEELNKLLKTVLTKGASISHVNYKVKEKTVKGTEGSRSQPLSQVGDE